MDEKKFDELISRHIDGELDDDSTKDLEGYLRDNPVAQYELEKAKKFDELLKHHMIKEEAPYELRESIIDQLNKPTLLDRLRSLFFLRPAGLAAFSSAVVIIVSVAVFSHVNRTLPVFAASIDNHIDYMQGNYPLEIVSGDMEEVLNWFNGKLDFAVSRPHVDLSGANLIGGRIVHVKDKKAAFFVFEKNGVEFSSMFVNMKGKRFPQRGAQKLYEGEKSVVYVKSDRGYKCVLCLHKMDGTGCLIVAKGSEEEVMKLLG